MKKKIEEKSLTADDSRVETANKHLAASRSTSLDDGCDKTGSSNVPANNTGRNKHLNASFEHPSIHAD